MRSCPTHGTLQLLPLLCRVLITLGLSSPGKENYQGVIENQLSGQALPTHKKWKAGPGNETTKAGHGNETTKAGPGNETTKAGHGNETTKAGPGNETTKAGPGNYLAKLSPHTQKKEEVESWAWE